MNAELLRTVRALPKRVFQERSAALEALGVACHAQCWVRLISHALPLAHAGWHVPVVFQVPVMLADVLAFYRAGDLNLLLTALGPPPSHPEAALLLTHLNGLVARGLAHRPQHVEMLLLHLKTACATVSVGAPVSELTLVCTRAQQRWEREVHDLETLQGLNTELAFHGYPSTFEKARRLQRQVVLYVGPPNSGKTHAAFERLAQVTQGAYLAPLRLLALEGRDRLMARGVPCALLTGEESVCPADARVVSSTIEMVDTAQSIDLAVIDEAQMIFDDSRGWAWTQAIVAVPANEVIIICSNHAVPAIESLLALCGERCEVCHFERKQQVQLLPQPVPMAALELGDAVVAFSRREVLMLRDQIAAQGHPVSVIYGALPPEVRRREAERFAQGDAHILVATDAIGMGLNLPIRRVLFSTLKKYDGQVDRLLSDSEVHQIAGRAGRFGMHEEGFSGVLNEAESTAAHDLKTLLFQTPQAPADFKAPVAPNGWHIDTIAARLRKTQLREVLGVFVEQLQLDNANFAVAKLEGMLTLAQALDQSAPQLSLKQRFTYAQAPVDTRTDAQLQQFLSWSSSHALTGQAGAPWFLQAVDEHSRLDRMEQALRACTLWLWLDLRFTGVYGHLDEVIDLRRRLNDGIEKQLKGKRPLTPMRPHQRPAKTL